MTYCAEPLVRHGGRLSRRIARDPVRDKADQCQGQRPGQDDRGRPAWAGAENALHAQLPSEVRLFVGDQRGGPTGFPGCGGRRRCGRTALRRQKAPWGSDRRGAPHRRSGPGRAAPPRAGRGRGRGPYGRAGSAGRSPARGGLTSLRLLSPRPSPRRPPRSGSPVAVPRLRFPPPVPAALRWPSAASR